MLKAVLPFSLGKVVSGDGKGVPGVLISVIGEIGAVLATMTTEADGSYKFPPLIPTPNIK